MKIKASGSITLKNLTEPFTVLLSNEMQQFSTDSNRKVTSAQSYYTDIIVYQGSTKRTDFIIGNVPSANGITVTKSSARITFAVGSGATISADAGTFTIPITLDGKTVNKIFSWSCGKQGVTGTSAKSVDIIANSQIFKSTDGGQTFSPETIKLTPTFQGGISFSKWQYSIDGGVTWKDVVSGNNGLDISSGVLTINKTSNLYTDTTTSITFKCISNNTSYYDTLTVIKLYDVTDIEVGGRNLLLMSSLQPAIYYVDGSGTTTSETFKGCMVRKFTNMWSGVKISFDKLVTNRGVVRPGDVLTYSIYAKTDDNATINVLMFNRSVDNTVGQGTIRGDQNLIALNTEWKLCAVTFTVTEEMLSSDKGITFFGYEIATKLTSGKSVYFSCPKLEKGNIATDWTPAPEDVDSQIQSLVKTTSETSSVVNKLNQSITNKVWQSDITNSVNNYDNSTGKAIRDRLTKTETSLSGVTSTVSDMKTTLDKKADGSTVQSLTNRVSKTEQDVSGFKQTVESTYTKKADFDSLEIGGRNLARKGILQRNQATSCVYDDSSKTYTIVSPANKKSNYYDLIIPVSANIKIPYGKGAIISFEVYSPKAVDIWMDVNNTVESGTAWNGNDNDINRKNSSSSIPQNTWTRYWNYCENNSSKNTNKVDIIINNSFGITSFPEPVTWKIRNFKVELGNKPTDWTPAPEDVDASIKSVSDYSKTSFEQLSNKFLWLVDGKSSSTSLTLTDSLVSAITKQFIIKSPDGSSTIITGGKIQTNSITSDMLSSSAIKSKNYMAGTYVEGAGYSVLGTLLDLDNGMIHTPSFYTDSSGNSFMSGTVHANAGWFGTDEHNWFLGTTTISNIMNDSGALTDGDYSYLKATDNTAIIAGDWYFMAQNSTMGLHSGLSTLNNGNFVKNPVDGKYYDFGIVEPDMSKDAKDYNKKFLYIRRADSTQTHPQDWEYLFRVDYDGKIWYKGNLIAGEGGMFLSTTGGTITGDLTVNGKLIATASSADKLLRALTINGKSFTGASAVDVGTIGIAYGGTGATSASGARANLGVIGTKNANGFYGLTRPDGNDSDWIRTTSNGIIPYQSGSYSSLGTSSWRFSKAYIDTIYGSLSGTATKAMQDGSGNVIADTYLRKDFDTVGQNVIFSSSVDIDDLTAGTLLVNGNARFINGLKGNLVGDVTGNLSGTSAYTEKLKTARKIGNASFDGSKDISLNDIGASASGHTHNYLPLSGGVITGDIRINGYITGEPNSAYPTNHGILLGHNAQDYMNFYEWGGLFQFYKSRSGTDTLLGKITENGWEGNVRGNLSGVASQATKLQNARNITIGNSKKSFDGTADITFSLSDIGASASGHTHNYAGSSSAGGNANAALKLATARTVSTNNGDFALGFNYDGSSNSTAYLSYYSCTVICGNKNNYPFHRFAKIDKLAGSYADKASTFLITQDYIYGGWGIVTIRLRTNSSTQASDVEVKWIARYNLAADFVQVGIDTTNGATYADAFIKLTGTYGSLVVRNLASGGRGSTGRTWSLINSKEVDNTTTSDALTSTECYINIFTAGTKLHNKAYTKTVTASDGATVSYANSAGTVNNVKDSGNSTATTFSYSKSSLNYNDYTWLAGWNGYELRAVNKSQFATSGHNHNIISLTDYETHVYDAKTTRTKNTFLAAPNGSDGVASFRKIEIADLPSHTHNYASQIKLADVSYSVSNNIITITKDNLITAIGTGATSEASPTAIGLMTKAEREKLASITVSDIGTVGANSIKGTAPIGVSVANGVATISHGASGVTSGAYGADSTNYFRIPKLIVNSMGHVTGATYYDITGANLVSRIGSNAIQNATNAVKATQDKNGNVISDTYMRKDVTEINQNFTFNNSVNINDLTSGSLLVTGSAKFVNGLKGNLTGDVVGNITGNVTGSLKGNADTATVATKANLLANLYSGRPTTANLIATGSGGLTTFKATSSMTEGKPKTDGHILHFYWDNTGGWDSQLFISNNSSPELQIRSMDAGSWGSWKTVLDSVNYTSYTVKKDGTGASGTWGININGNASTSDKWKTARTITIGSSAKTLDGSSNVLWSLSDIGAASSSHTHGLLNSDFGVILEDTTEDSGWSMLNDSYNGFLLKSIRVQRNSPDWILDNYSAGIVFGGADTKGVISTKYNFPSIKFAGGNGMKPVWWINLTGTTETIYNLDNMPGNSATATKLKTARKIGNVLFDGSADITLSQIGASAIGHTHNYLPLSGGTLTGDLNFSSGDSITWNSGSWFQRIKTVDDSTDNTPVFILQQSGNSGSTWTDLLTVKDNGQIVANTFVGSLSGNATSATTANSATKATQDGAGNVITSKYVTIDTAQTISGAKTFSKELVISNTTASTSKTTGALKVKGGIATEGQMSANKVMVGDGCTLEMDEYGALNFVFL